MQSRQQSEGLTPELRSRFIGYLKLGNYVETVCRATGISVNTYYRWMAEAREGREPYATFALEVDEALAIAEMGDLAQLKKHSAEHWQAASWRLERRHPDRWGRVNKTEMSGPGGGPIKAITATTSVTTASPAAAAAVMRELFGNVTPSATSALLLDAACEDEKAPETEEAAE